MNPVSSLRGRLVLAIGGALLLTLTLLGIFTGHQIRAALNEQFENELQSKAHSLVEQFHYEYSVEPIRAVTGDADGSAAELIAIWDDSGQLLARSSRLQGHDLPQGDGFADTVVNGRRLRCISFVFTPIHEDLFHDDPAQKEHGVAQKLGYHLSLGDDERQYLAALQPAGLTQVATPPAHLRLTMARDPAGIIQAGDDILRTLWLCGLGALLVTLTVLVLVVRWSFRPLGRLSERLASIGPSEQHPTLMTPEVPTELRPLVGRIDELIDRLGEAFSRERAFNAEVSHELRTPLTGLLTAIDVALRQPRSEAEYRKTLERSRGICLQLQELVTTLLSLSRIDTEGAQNSVRTYVALLPVVEDCWDSLAERATERGLSLTREVVPCELRADRDRLLCIVSNLLDNAVSHADAGGRITVGVSVTEAHITLRVANSGSTVAAEDAPKVFQRFWRGTTSQGNHHGLGLAIVRRLVLSMRGSITATSTPGGLFEIRITLPGRAAVTPSIAAST
jgi:two-component system heavy metal sensor histidine kinase CusS